MAGRSERPAQPVDVGGGTAGERRVLHVNMRTRTGRTLPVGVALTGDGLWESPMLESITIAV